MADGLSLAQVDIRKDGRVRLVTFSHAGSGAAPFLQWAPSLPADVALFATRRPGREVRYREPLLATIAAMAEEAVRALAKLPSRPTLLFGHSVGALVAYEAAHHLEAKGDPPLLLAISARPAPHERPPAPPLSHLPDERLIDEALRYYGTFPGQGDKTRELMELMLPALRGDLKASELYRPRTGGRLRCPIWACYGTEDHTVGRERASAWSSTTEGPTEVTAFRGGHFYPFEQASGFVAALSKKLFDLGRPAFHP